MTKQKKQSFLYGSTILMASMIVVKLIGAVFKIPLTAIVGTSAMAYFGSAYNLYTVVYALTVTGLSAAVARMVAENATKGRYKDVKNILKLSNRLFLPIGVFGFVVIVSFAKLFSNMLDSPNSYWSIVMIAPALLFCCLMASYRGYYEGLSDMIPTAMVQIVEAVTKLATGLILAFMVMKIGNNQFVQTGKVFGVVVENQDQAFTATVPYAAAAAILGVTISTLIGFIYIYIRYKIKGDYITKEMIINSPAPIRMKVLLYRLIKISIPITLGAVVIQLSSLIDTLTTMARLQDCFDANPQLLIDQYSQYMRSGEQMNDFLFGCYINCLTLFSLVSAFTNIFGKSALPNVTSAWTQKDRKNVKVSIESVIRMTFTVGAPMAFGLAFLSRPILSLIYSSSKGTIGVGSQLLPILGIAALFLAIMTPINAIFQGIGRMDLPVKFLLVGATVKLILNIILIGNPSINIMGASISTFACYFLIAILSLTKLNKIVPVNLNFNSMIIKPVLSGLLCGLVARFLYNFLAGISASKIITLVSIALAGISYVIFMGIFNGVTKEDVLMLPKGNKILKTLEKIKYIR